MDFCFVFLDKYRFLNEIFDCLKYLRGYKWLFYYSLEEGV